jgi:cytochrome c biogenesis protein CcmG/thiol:disulfide interchange protein DsbE
VPAKRRHGGVLLGSLALAIVVAVAVGAALGSGPADTTIDPGPAKTRVAGVATVGSPAPEFDLRRLSGPGRVALRSYRGRPVIVNFWASWCSQCREEFPVLRDVVTQHRGDGLAVVGITYKDIASDSRDFATQHHANWTLLDGGETGATGGTYGVRSIPQTFFIDRHGVIRARSFGLPSRAAIDAAVRRISRR